MQSPKSLFQLEKGAATRLGEITSDPSFQKALYAALAQMQHNFGPSPDMGTSAANFWKLEGAKQVLTILCVLHVPPTQAEVKKHEGLDYNA